MSRPSDHIDSPDRGDVIQPRLGVVGWLRWIWRQLTSMRTALLLLLLLAIAAVPGSLVPQRQADPNGVVQYFRAHPDLAPVLDKFQLFDVYGSVWFSAIYILLFVSLIGCVIPRTKHHIQALLAKPPKTPVRLSRMVGYTTRILPATDDDAVESARRLLRGSGYRAAVFRDSTGASVSAERGYLRETGNLVFHIALMGVLLAVAVGAGFGFTGQRIVVAGQTFVNGLVSYDSFSPGRFFTGGELAPYSIKLDDLDVTYETKNENAIGHPLDFTAHVTTTEAGGASDNTEIKVNEPLNIGGTQVYLLGNGYAPVITVRDPAGHVVFKDAVPFLQQDANFTSLGVVKVPDGLKDQVGMIGFFYPTKHKLDSGAYTSTFPGPRDPLLTLNVYTGDLGLNGGVPKSVYSLDTDSLTQLSGGDTGIAAIEVAPGQTAQLPNGLGSVSLDSVKRFASLSIHSDPVQGWVLVFALCILGGLLASLFVPRRRMWAKVADRGDGTVLVEYAGLARGDDPNLQTAVAAFADRHEASLAESRERSPV